MYKYSFEKLAAWRRARKLNSDIYKITGTFPSTERFGLTSQSRRAFVSISSNIAEGSGRTTNKDQAHFYRIAYGSLMEVLSQLYLCLDLGFLTEKTFVDEIKPQIESISKPLFALMNKK